MPYNYNHSPSRRSSHFLNKWTIHPKDVIPMWLADMDLPTAPSIQNALHKQVKHGVLGYEMPSIFLYDVISKRMKKLYNWEVNPEDIVYTPGVNNGYNIAARILCSPEKGYLIQTPVYNEFHDTEHKTGFAQQVNRLSTIEHQQRIEYEIDFDDFERKAQKVGMFLLCNPHNPVGKIHSNADLLHMAEICLKYNVTIVSDEIHSEIILNGGTFTPLASLSPEIEAQTITLISASKAFNVPGLSCAFAIIPNPVLKKQFEAIATGMSFETSSLGLTAAYIAYSGKADSWLRGMNQHLKNNRDFLLNFIDQYLPGIKTTSPEATYLAWLDCSSLNLNPTACEFFLQKARVAFSDGGKFGKGFEHFVRINFGTSHSILKQGLERTRKAMVKEGLLS